MIDRRWALQLTLAGAAFVGVETVAAAKDYFLTIGGGNSPTGNQVSLEKNVQFLRSVLAEKRPDQPRHDVYFADGDDAHYDVHYRDPEFLKNCPPARRMLAELFGDPDSMDFVYRNHEVADVAGPANLSLLEARFRELAQELRPGDRLVVYATGHGGPAATAGRGGRRRGAVTRGRTNPYNTTLYLWDDQRIAASDFAAWLDRFPRDVTVMLVMVQCHSGGYSHTIFEQATANLGIAPHARCGFFSQVYDRAAAGCTPDVDEADYQEYSSFFWAALAGHTRTGAAVSGVDYDQSGEISFAEAHAYAVLASDTIDIPVRTSEALLYELSRAAGSSAGSVPGDSGRRGRGGRGRGAPPTRGPIDTDGRTETPDGAAGEQPTEGAVIPAASQVPADLRRVAGPIADLATRARPEQRAILLQLPFRLGLPATASVEDVRQRLSEVERAITEANSRLVALSRRRAAALAIAQDDVRRIWPELHSDYAPLAMALANERAEEFVTRVSALDSYRDLSQIRAEVERASQERLDAERSEAKLQRLLRICECVVLAENLPKVAPPEIVARYEQLLALESGTLAASPQ
jgi:hypothetical protein